MRKYLLIWFKAGALRGECYQELECDARGNPQAVVGYRTAEGQSFVMPEPHEAVPVGSYVDAPWIDPSAPAQE